MTEREHLIALYSYSYFGPARTKLLIDFFGTPKKAFYAKRIELLGLNLNPKAVEGFLKYREKFDFLEYFSELERKNIKAIVAGEQDYPVNLSDLPDKPLVLYIRGNIKARDVNAVAIVGSRKMTSYGREVARKFSSELANLGVTIVSGLAFGIDLASHKAALESGGRCIAVLAGGVDNITPRSNEWLGMSVIKSGGAVLSEFPPGTIPQKYFFPFRNRIISGLSKAVIVVEGAIRSGTIHTVRHALDQGRQVFAVPGPITSPMSQGPLYLIKQGAKMATEIKDITEELNMQLKVDSEAVAKFAPGSKFEDKLLKVLTYESLHIDEISRLSGYPMNKISSSLTIMELKGLVKNLGGGIYRKS